VIRIDNLADPRLELFQRNERGLANRPARRNDDGEGLFMAEGDLVVERALDAGCVPVAALVDDQRPPAIAGRFGEAPVYAGGDQLRAHVTGLGTPQSIVAVFHRPARPTVEQLASTSTHLVLVEAVDNPVNVGGIVRNAAGLGWHGLVLDGTSADPLARRSLRVSMGHAVRFPYARQRHLAPVVNTLVRKGFDVVALTPRADAVALHALPTLSKVAVIIGSERAGLSADVLATAPLAARIPMANGVDSLNAAAASAIACFALRPQA
jgi:tRNA G18 (ribose-2'-O)-methylase SpoU